MMANFKTRTCTGILAIELGRAYSQKDEENRRSTFLGGGQRATVHDSGEQQSIHLLVQASAWSRVGVAGFAWFLQLIRGGAVRGGGAALPWRAVEEETQRSRGAAAQGGRRGQAQARPRLGQQRGAREEQGSSSLPAAAARLPSLTADGEGAAEAGEKEDRSGANVWRSADGRPVNRQVEPPRPAAATSCAFAMVASTSSCAS